MTAPIKKLLWDHARNEPFVNQGTLHGWELSWNPDDNKFYLTKDNWRTAIYKAWRNVIQHARNRKGP
jgi:hypothetical protein